MAEPAHILLAENDRGIAGLLEVALTQRGYVVDVVEDGAAALLGIAAGGVDLLVTDLEMPIVAGDQLVAVLDGDESAAEGVPLPAATIANAVRRAPPIIVISAYLTDPLAGEFAARPRIRSTWRKPFDLFEFADSIDSSLIPGAGGRAGESPDAELPDSPESPADEPAPRDFGSGGASSLGAGEGPDGGRGVGEGGPPRSDADR